VDRVGTQVRPVLHPAGPGALGPLRGVHSSAAAGHRVLVVLDHAHADQRNLVLLVPVGYTEVGRRAQVGAAVAGALGVAVLVVVELVLLAPAQRGPRRAGLFALRTPGRLGAALLARRRPTGIVVLRGRHRGVAAVA